MDVSMCVSTSFWILDTDYARQWNPQADLLKQLAKTSLHSAASKAAANNKRSSNAAGLPSPTRPARDVSESSIFASDSSASTSTSMDTSLSLDSTTSLTSTSSRQSKRRRSGRTQSASVMMDPEALQKFSELAALLDQGKSRFSHPVGQPVASTSKLPSTSSASPKVFPGTKGKTSPFSRSVSDSAAVLPPKPAAPAYDRARRSTTLPPSDPDHSLLLPPDPQLEPILEPTSSPTKHLEALQPDLLDKTTDDWDAADNSFDLVLSQVPAEELEAIMHPQQPSFSQLSQPLPAAPLKPIQAPSKPASRPAAPTKTLPKQKPPLATIKKPLAPSLSTNRPPSSQGTYQVSARLSQTLKQGFKKPTFVKPPPLISKAKIAKPVVPQEVMDLTIGIDFAQDDGDLSF